MKYQVGDKVLVLHSNEEGQVVDIINNTMVLIDVDGVRFPVYTDQIDFPYFKMFSSGISFEKPGTEKKKEKVYIDNVKNEKPSPKHKLIEGMWLSFLPIFDKDVFDDDVVDRFKLYLINQTDKAYDFSYQVTYGGKPGFELKNQILSLADFYLHDVAFEELNDGPKFEFEFALLNVDK